MAQIAFFVGIDVSKLWLDAHRHPDGECARFANDGTGWSTLLTWLSSVEVVRVGVEATAGFERGVVKALSDEGVVVRILDPRRVRLFAQARGRWAKNDRLDARTIAEFTALADTPSKLPDDKRDHIGELLTARQALLDVMTQLGNVGEHLRDRRTTGWFSRHAASLTRQVKVLERRIGEAIAAEPSFAHLAHLLRSAKGIGLLFAAAAIARLPELGQLDRRKIGSLVGVAPFDDDSAQSRGARHIQGGRTLLRNLLYMATLSAIRHNKVIAAHYRQLRTRGKQPKVAIVACMRKLLTILNAMVATNQTWRDREAAAE
jgi:transposase